MAKRIGMIHYKTGGTDGVSLEMDKWQRVFTEAGHEVFYCSGRHDREIAQDGVSVTVIPELFYHRPEAELVNRAAFKDLSVFQNFGSADAHAADSGYADASAMKSANADASAHAADSASAEAAPTTSAEAAFRRELERQTEALVPRLRKWIADNSLEVIVAENIWSAAVHPAAAKALRIAVQDTQIRVLGHHHDFFWERIGGAEPTCRTAELLADFCLPPNAEAYRHAVINSLAGETLRRRRGIQAGVIPNVFDFSGPDWVRDDFNRDFRQ
ncbi:MAG: hypothetical protein K9K78_06280, partial [Spirochaetales bacterium]|nr:hypothetical protein [Spirochaetales bacterium]